MRRSRAGLSEAATMAVLILVSLIVAGIVVIWGALVTRSASEAGRAAAVTEVQRIRQDVSLVYWGPDGTIILTSRARDPVTIVRVYVDSSPRTVSWAINPGETKTFNLGVGYDPLKEVTALTDKNELIVLWRSRGSGIAAGTTAVTTTGTTGTTATATTTATPTTTATTATTTTTATTATTTTTTGTTATTTTTTTTVARIAVTASLTRTGSLTVHVTNVGNVNVLLTQITLRDMNNVIICQYPVDQWISPGQTRTFSYQCSGVIGGATYTVTVAGQAPDGTPVTAQTQVRAT
jgi:hypothetical protein